MAGKSGSQTNRIYLQQNVFDAALARIRWVLSEFKHVYVGVSGGKDSDIVLRLTLMAAEQLGRLPQPAIFIDQEAEWQATIDHMRVINDDPRVRLHWLQVPFREFNATSVDHPWLRCWDPAVESDWVRPKEPDSIHENAWGCDRFQENFGAYLKHLHPREPAVYISGMRAEESPARAMALTIHETYKGETWGRVWSKKLNHYVFYPIYDWSYLDVWKAIHDHGWPYNRLYDYMYQYGIPTREMRVSNVHHETAIKSLWFLQEIEPETWNRLTARLQGVSSCAQLSRDFLAPKTLPPMFDSWEEYRDHLLANLITDPSDREWYRRTFAAHDNRYDDKAYQDLLKTEIAMILVNDREGTKLGTFHASHFLSSKGRGTRGGHKAFGLASLT